MDRDKFDVALIALALSTGNTVKCTKLCDKADYACCFLCKVNEQECNSKSKIRDFSCGGIGNPETCWVVQFMREHTSLGDMNSKLEIVKIVVALTHRGRVKCEWFCPLGGYSCCFFCDIIKCKDYEKTYSLTCANQDIDECEVRAFIREQHFGGTC